MAMARRKLVEIWATKGGWTWAIKGLPCKIFPKQKEPKIVEGSRELSTLLHLNFDGAESSDHSSWPK